MAADLASSSKPASKYDVFLSFRGEDTRKGFTDHLYTTLQKSWTIAFRDDEELQKGQDIKQAILQAIEDSLCSIVVLSQNYASSTWCLDELVKILESSKKLGRQVIPIFYGVDPSDVRHQTGKFAEAFKLHQDKFSTDKEKGQRWRNALKEVANLCGLDSKDWLETKLIKEVLEWVWTKVHPTFQCDYDGLVGIHSRINTLDSYLRMGLNEVRFIGLWGMGGIGKTTLARILYQRISSQFEISCLLLNVKETCAKRDGLAKLQSKLLSCLIKDMEIVDEFEGKVMIKNLLWKRKVLLVLDDVDNKSQLENLAESKKWFGPGSRVIITTRDEHLLRSHDVDDIHPVRILNEAEALQLFAQKAFKRDQPKEGYLQLSRAVVEYANGLPLALKVLGSLLCERSVHEWEDVLRKLRQSPPDGILNPLKISFDSLDDEQKDIFLDIACFYNGMEEDCLINILELGGYKALLGINVLMEKALLSRDGSNLRMHDLLQEMGKRIVVQESSGDVSRQTRLWSYKDIVNVLGENKGTGAIQAISLQDYYEDNPNLVYLKRDCFSKMHNLKTLCICASVNSTFKFSKSFNGLPNSLRILEWNSYPLKSLPHSAPLDQLVSLQMQDSNIKYLCEGNQLPKMMKVKVIDLSMSKRLLKFPDVSGVPNLEKLVLKCCISLVKVHPSLGQHKKLVEVNLEKCCNLRSLPSRLKMESLELLNLNYCRRLRKLPQFGKNMKYLSVLCAMECNAIVEVPPSVDNLTGLTLLDLSHCENLVCLPESIFQLNSLKDLDISDCRKISRLPEILKENDALEALDCTGTAIRELPQSIHLLKRLRKLSFLKCGELESKSWMQRLGLKRQWSRMSFVFPPTFSALSSLEELDLRCCNLSDGSIQNILLFLPSSLYALDLSRNNFVNLPPGCFSKLVRLRFLYLEECESLHSLPELPPCVQFVSARNSSSMEPLSDAQQLWDLFAPLDLQATVKDRLQILIPGRKIPSWFDKKIDLIVNVPDGWSFVLDIPKLSCRSQWWGIAVCVRLEKQCYGRHVITWECASPNIKGSLPTHSLYCDHLGILFLGSENFKVWELERGDCNQLQFTFRPESTDLIGCPFPKSECRWRFVCEQDFVVWRKTMLQPDRHIFQSPLRFGPHAFRWTKQFHNYPGLSVCKLLCLMVMLIRMLLLLCKIMEEYCSLPLEKRIPELMVTGMLSLLLVRNFVLMNSGSSLLQFCSFSVVLFFVHVVLSLKHKSCYSNNFIPT